MNQPRRLPSGGRIQRKQALEFTFQGKTYQGYQGDTLASALLANDVKIVGRSFKYHRLRGIVGHGAEEPNAIMQIGRGARTLPVQRATQVELYEGLDARCMTAWPSLEFDLRAVLGWFSPLLPAGFYYKTFMRPQWLWPVYEWFIRHSAGWGEAPSQPDPDHYDHMNAHCEVLIVGAGPAGLAAALAAGRSGARVLLVDEQPEIGGSVLGSRATIDQRPASDWLEHTRRELAAMANVTLLLRATAWGYFDHQFFGILERRTDHLPPALARGSRQRLWRVRAKKVILAAGAFERPLVFAHNDRPGVMLASSVSMYLQRWAVQPGEEAVVFTNNDSAYQTALDLLDAGVKVNAVVDPRPLVGALADTVRQRGVEVLTQHVVVEALGARAIDGVQVMSWDGQRPQGTMQGISCDLLAVSGGWNPAVHLHAHTGGHNRWDETQACFVPDSHAQGARSIGGCRGVFDLAECLRQGYTSGHEAALSLGYVGSSAIPQHEVITSGTEQPLAPLWWIPGLKREAKQFIDLQNDTSVADIQLAVREGYDSIEQVKRYTALGFGTDQGKLGNINGLGIVAGTLKQPIATIGTTTFRPPCTPVTFGAIAGRHLGPQRFDPVRKTPMHDWHVAHGAVFEDVGQWKRPWYYPQPGESPHQAVERECRAVRRSVGVLDASTLGKIAIQGPDALELLNRVYINDWQTLAIGRCRYGLMLKEDGKVFDDGVTTRFGPQQFLMTTTTGNAAAVLAWLERWLQTEWPQMQVYLTSVTDHWATLAVAGPKSRDVLRTLCADIDFDRAAFPFMSMREGTVAGVAARVCRISFSGELGYEINVPAQYGLSVWEAVMAAGAEFEITPYGTEAMHILRAEKGFIIVGQETDGSVTPVDLGMSRMLGHQDFLGKRSLQCSDNLREDRKQLVGLCSCDGTTVLPEGGQIVESDDTRKRPVPMLGHVTSSYWSVALNRPIALALLRGGRKRLGQRLWVAAAGTDPLAVEVVEPVFYDAEGARQYV